MPGADKRVDQSAFSGFAFFIAEYKRRARPDIPQLERNPQPNPAAAGVSDGAALDYRSDSSRRL